MHGWRDTARPPGARSSICRRRYELAARRQYEHFRGIAGCRTPVRARVGGLQSHSYRGCGGPLFWLQTRDRTRHVVACALRRRTRRTRVFTALHAGCGFQATHCVLRPHRPRELDGRPTRGFQPARFTGCARSSARQRNPLKLISFPGLSPADLRLLDVSAIRGMGLAATSCARWCTRARCSYCGGE